MVILCTNYLFLVMSPIYLCVIFLFEIASVFNSHYFCTASRTCVLDGHCWILNLYRSIVYLQVWYLRFVNSIQGFCKFKTLNASFLFYSLPFAVFLVYEI